MLDLNKIKAALFDFDDTLCIHTRRPRDVRVETDYIMNFIREEDNWSGSVPSKHMKKFIDICIKRNIQVGLISSTGYFVSMQAKHKWAEDNYGVKFENYCVGKPELKLVELAAIAQHIGCKKSEILLVDDLYPTLEKASIEGFTACSPMEIVNYIELNGE